MGYVHLCHELESITYIPSRNADNVSLTALVDITDGVIALVHAEYKLVRSHKKLDGSTSNPS